jgi:dihydropyrimidinase
MHDLAFKNGSVYNKGRFEKTHVYVTGERIADITTEDIESRRVVDCSGLQVLPGLIDPHVHMALDLGVATSCDDFDTGSVAAIKGGVTTIIDFLSPIQRESELSAAFANRLKEAEASKVDYTLHATLGNFQGDVSSLVTAVKALGLNSIKVFTTYSESNRKVPESILETLLDSDILTMVHAEDDSLVDESWSDIWTFEASRPLESELKALKWLIKSLGKGKLYVVHVSSGSGVELIANRERVYIESCPHYFTLSNEFYKRSDGGRFLLAPSLRSPKECQKLKRNIGKVNTIGTDHCPFLKSQKLGSKDASQIPKGIGSIQYSFLIMHTLFGDQVIDKMSKNVADLFGLKGKGQLLEGYDADLVLFDPEGSTIVASESGTCDYSVYEGKILTGKIISTVLRGTFAMENGYLRKTQGKFLRSENSEGTY